MEVNISHVIHGNVLAITLKDENCDATNSIAVRDKILSLIGETGCSKVVADLGLIKFIDSSGLAAILAIQRSLYGEGGMLKIARLNQSIRTVFEIVSMHRMFEIFPTVGDALKSF